ncbi:FUSC family protein, partial [Staphylococcus epidermidis]
HAYVNRRYRVAATAATLMALLQPLMLAPGSDPAVGERLADTLIGAALAWLFSFVLPSWERAALPRLAGQLRAALARHAD